MGVSDVSDALPPLALLAGGKATRLGPIAAARPKSLVEIAGEPFIAHQLRHLAHEGVTRVVICIGHLGEQIEDVVGDGGAFGCQVSYSRDGPHLKGTAGALKRALPQLGDAFMVMYGDSFLPIALAPVWAAFLRLGRPALMTVHANADRWDRSNAVYIPGQVVRYDKRNPTPDMRHIDYGLGILTPGPFADAPDDAPTDLADIYSDLARRGDLAGFEAQQRFYEIGSVSGIAETDAFLRERLGRRGATGAGSAKP